MKIRSGFISNSSSASFILDKTKLTPLQIAQVKDHINEAKKYVRAHPEEFVIDGDMNEISKYKDKFDKDSFSCSELGFVDDSDKWEIIEYKNTMKCLTSMTNFELENFLRYIGAANAVRERNEWGYVFNSNYYVECSNYSDIYDLAKRIIKLRDMLDDDILLQKLNSLCKTKEKNLCFDYGEYAIYIAKYDNYYVMSAPRLLDLESMSELGDLNVDNPLFNKSMFKRSSKSLMTSWDVFDIADSFDFLYLNYDIYGRPMSYDAAMSMIGTNKCSDCEKDFWIIDCDVVCPKCKKTITNRVKHEDKK